MTGANRPEEIRTAEPLDEDACWRMLSSQEVGRVAMSAPEGLVVLPVNYVVSNRTILFRTSEFGLLGSAADDGRTVAFQADSFDRGARYGWTVLVRGELRRASSASSLASADRTVDTWLHRDDPVVATVVVDSI